MNYGGEGERTMLQWREGVVRVEAEKRPNSYRIECCTGYQLKWPAFLPPSTAGSLIFRRSPGESTIATMLRIKQDWEQQAIYHLVSE